MPRATAVAIWCLVAAVLTLGGCRRSPPSEQTSSTAITPRGQSDIRWTCGAGDECEVAAILPDGQRKQIFKGVVRSPAVRRLDDHVSEFRTSCGSPCSASIFVDFRDGRVSSPVENVVAADPVQMLVASAGTNEIEVRLMFGDTGQPLTVRRNFAPVAALVSAIRQAEFVENGALKLRYLRDPDYQEEEDVIPLDLNALQHPR
jgi:hypothetical protein